MNDPIPQSPNKIGTPRDPSLENGGLLVYNKEIPLEFVTSEEDENEIINVRLKIILNSDEEEQVNHIHFEMLCDSDLFFIYESDYTDENFDQIKGKHNFDITMNNFPKLLIDILDQYIDNSEEYSIAFIQQTDTSGILSFHQILKFKVINLFELEFHPAQEDYVKESVQYRFSSSLDEMNLVQNELKKLHALVKVKNPTVSKKMSPR